MLQGWTVEPSGLMAQVHPLILRKIQRMENGLSSPFLFPPSPPHHRVKERVGKPALQNPRSKPSGFERGELLDTAPVDEQESGFFGVGQGLAQAFGVGDALAIDFENHIADQQSRLLGR